MIYKNITTLFMEPKKNPATKLPICRAIIESLNRRESRPVKSWGIYTSNYQDCASDSEHDIQEKKKNDKIQNLYARK